MTEHRTVEVNGNCRSCARLLDEVGHRMQEVARLKALCDREADRLQDFCDVMEGERLWESTILASIENLKAAGETHHEP